MSSLSGRVAFVTGAGSGIGAATAQLLVARGAVVYGADLAAARTDGTEPASRPVPCLNPVRLDVRAERAVPRFGGRQPCDGCGVAGR